MIESSPSPLVLSTSRLHIGLPPLADAESCRDYYERNRAHLEPWDPARDAVFYTRAFWRDVLATNRQEYAEGVSLRVFLRAREDPRGPVIGSCNLSQIVRGVFHSALLGYSVDAAHEGRGLMTEAVGAVVDHAFGTLNLHRIQANYSTGNERSAALLRRLGFVEEGRARDYLYLAGRWRDHVLTARLNPDWRDYRDR
jgi:ribosomal-protein-alanine N-acetyltransferase